MINQKHLRQVRERLHKYAEIRRQVIADSGTALHDAKRAIFSLHREEKKEAEDRMTKSTKQLQALQTLIKKYPQITHEGAYHAAVEEYVEATLFHQFVNGKTIEPVKTIPIEDAVFLAGMCDLPGELYRYAVRAATRGDMETVMCCHDVASDVIGALIDFDLTSYLRTKFDQAKQALQKLEQVVYDLSLRKK